MPAKTYMVMSSPMVTTGPPTAVALAAATTKTLISVQPATGIIIRPIAWGISFNGYVAATPGTCELIETNVAPTVTAYAAADVMPYGDANAPANTAGGSGVPLNLGTANSGYAASVEGATTATRVADVQLIAPSNQYGLQWPLGREFEVIPQRWLRVRATFAAIVSCTAYLIFEV